MAENVNKRFGSNIRALRIHCGMSQSDVALATGYTRSHICKIENGSCTISAEQILKLSLLFDLPVHLFFLGFYSQEASEKDPERYIDKLDKLGDRDLRLVFGLINHMLTDKSE